MASDLDQKLCRALRDHPYRYSNRYDDKARGAFLEILFRSVTNDRPDYLAELFPSGFPESYSLRDAQGVAGIAEYTEAAKGQRCGHIFKQGEACYHCMTCTDDPTCVLCSRCFDASDHDGHRFHISASTGNSGCCDCGDQEAWKRPLNCAIHTGSEQPSTEARSSSLPQDLIHAIETTIGRTLDYFCDVISCSPEQLRLPKTEESIEQDESLSRLGTKWYGDGDVLGSDPEYCLIVWNDEKHTEMEVSDVIKRACRQTSRFGDTKAMEANDLGRSILRHSRDLRELNKMSKVIESIKVTTTIRASRDTFREQMCGTILDWLADIAGCSVGQDHHILRYTICNEMLQEWRVGSEAYNAQIGRSGIDDHEHPENDILLAAIPDFWERPIVPEAAEMDDDHDEEMREPERDTEADPMEVEGLSATRAEEAAQGAQRILLTQQMDLLRMTRPPITQNDNLPAGDDAIEVPDGHEHPEGEFGPATNGFMSIVIDLDDGRSIPEGPTRNYQAVPTTPHGRRRLLHGVQPVHWAVQPPGAKERTNLPPHEDLSRNIRLDSMILFDMRLWKKARIDLRDLYIGTVVNVPDFKRILGLRFSGLYTTLSQLYLIADREPDHSIINLSLQMLTSPSITEEVIDKGNFLTNLMAILYTFLTSRQVGFPQDVRSSASLAFDTGSVTNRRLYHFFSDLRFFLSSEPVRKKIAEERQYLLQFIDLIKLSQGICPNVRAVGDHVEYETDAWIGASLLTREINKLCRQFSEAFSMTSLKDSCRQNTTDALYTSAFATVFHSIGLERQRFDQAEIKELARFKELKPFEFDYTAYQTQATAYRVIDYVVEKGALSFHHALHYTLSWLLEGTKSLSNAELRAIFYQVGQDFLTQHGPLKPLPHGFHEPQDALLALYDFPLRVCAWLSQMKAGVWVRNGMSLRHQMSQYRAVTFRDVGFHRDIFLLQTALVTCDPSRVLATMIDRYGLDHWMRGMYGTAKLFEDSQQVDIVEDFVYLLIMILSDRAPLITLEDEPEPLLVATRKDVVHTLCFKPLSFSDLNAKLNEKVQDYQCLHDVLDEMTIFRAPEGLTDCGTFELKQEYLEELDPFNINYNKNQREEAENIYKKRMSEKLSRPIEDIVLEPHLRSISSGVYHGLPCFTKTPVFAQIIYYTLHFATVAKTVAPDVPATRIESLLLVVLQLALIASLEDDTTEHGHPDDSAQSFVRHALSTKAFTQSQGRSTIVESLQCISNADEYAACRPKIKHLLKLFYRKQSDTFSRATARLEFPYGRLDTASPASVDQELGAKKKQALERKAQVMAQFQQQQQNFMDNNGMSQWLDDDLSDTEIDTPGSSEKETWKYPSGICILCQEETNDGRPYGTFGMFTHSNVLRQTNLDDADWVREALCTPSSLDHSIEHIRPFGVAGDNYQQVVRLTAAGDQISTDRQGLGKGWPMGFTKQSPLSSGCGHLMHYACFDHYFRSIVKRHTQQVARHHPERTENYEFVCPLCKALGNAFLPILWRDKEMTPTETFSKTSSLEDFLRDGFGRILRKQQDLEQSNFVSAQTSSSAWGSVRVKFSDAIMKPSPFSQSVGFGTSIPPSMAELAVIFRRLGETIHANRLNRVQISPSSAHSASTGEALLSILSSSVSAVEIAQRGVNAEPGTNLLERTSTQTLTHLRVLSETINTYLSVSELSGEPFTHDFALLDKRIFRQLFTPSASRINRETERTSPNSTDLNAAPLLLQDVFDVFTQSCFALGPTLDVSVHHLLHLCYLAHILQVIIAYTQNQQGLLHLLGNSDSQRHHFPPPRIPTSSETHALLRMIYWINCERAIEGYSTVELAAGSESAIYTLIRSYSLTFLRKALVFLHVNYWVDFPSTVDYQSPEVDRLSSLLGLPSLVEVTADVDEYDGNVSTRNLLGGWIRSFAAYEYNHAGIVSNNVENVNQPNHTTNLSRNIFLPHPAPFELIGLPKHFDVLMEEANRRKCPTTGKDLTDPALCLFCGTILCVQAYCCMKNKGIGPANLHVEKCSSPIGVFLSIRKCTVLVLHVVSKPPPLPLHNPANTTSGQHRLPAHGFFPSAASATITTPSAATSSHYHLPPSPNSISSTPTTSTLGAFISNGSWLHAPYLTRHGEVDPGLRQRHQLFLNQKRYDRLLRDVWLMLNGGNLWSTVARKLEGEINGGGWESI